MTLKEAWRKSVKTMKFPFGRDDHSFAEVGWKSETSGAIQERILVTVQGDTAIEIGWDGAFVNAYPASAEGYFPLEIKKADRKKYIAKLMSELAGALVR